MSAQMVVTIAGVTKVSNAENAPYKVETVEGVTLKVWDRDGIVSRIMGLFGQPVTFTYRDETRQYNDRNGNPRTGVDHVITGVMPGGTPAPQVAPAVQAVPQAAAPAPVAAAAQPAAQAAPPASRDMTIWRQTAMKIVGHLLKEEGADVDLAVYCSTADDLVHYFETGRLPDNLTDGQHRAIEALCGRLDTLEPTGAPWRDRVKRQLRKQYGREVPSMNDVRAQEAAWLIDVLQAKVNTHDNPPPPPPPPPTAPPSDPIGQAVGEAFPGAEEARPPFASDDDIPFQPTTMDNYL